MDVRANWWTERWLKLWVSLSFYLSPSPSLCVSLPLSHYLSIHPSINLPTNLSTYLPTYLSIYPSIYLSIWKLRDFLQKCLQPSHTCHHFETAAKPTRLTHFWQSAESIALATINAPWTSKTWSEDVEFYHFDLQKRFTPQPRALFAGLNFEKLFRPWGAFTILTSKSVSRHIRFVNNVNFQKCSKAVVLFTIWLRNVLRATAACAFCRAQLPKVFQSCSAFYNLTSKCASCHSRVRFLQGSTSKSAPKLRCFLQFDFETCFAPQRRAIFDLSYDQMAPPAALLSLYFATLRSRKTLEKHSVSRLSTFSRALSFFIRPGSSLIFFLHLSSCFLFSYFLSSSFLFSDYLWLFPPLLLHLSIWSEVWLPNFFRLVLLEWIVGFLCLGGSMWNKQKSRKS